jgi:hypothetical protein
MPEGNTLSVHNQVSPDAKPHRNDQELFDFFWHIADTPNPESDSSSLPPSEPEASTSTTSQSESVPRGSYRRVKALVVCWGMNKDEDDIGPVVESFASYNYDVEEYVLSSASPGRSLVERLTALQKEDLSKALLIVSYHGHGSRDEGVPGDLVLDR